jgi:High-affinity nickel-transport protein
MEAVDTWLTGLLEGAPLLIALAIAFVLGLRHATDPDHLVAVTSLVVADEGDVRAAVRLGAWWGVGHASVLLAIGLPLIAFKEELPAWLEGGAETAVGVVIVLLAARVIVRWRRPTEPHPPLRTARQALGIGMLHGLAGTGAVVLLLVAALPGRLEAAAALAVFAPMSIVSMALCTSAFAWALMRGALYRTVLVPAVGAFGLLFGLWYVL